MGMSPIYLYICPREPALSAAPGPIPPAVVVGPVHKDRVPLSELQVPLLFRGEGVHCPVLCGRGER